MKNRQLDALAKVHAECDDSCAVVELVNEIRRLQKEVADYVPRPGARITHVSTTIDPVTAAFHPERMFASVARAARDVLMERAPFGRVVVLRVAPVGDPRHSEIEVRGRSWLGE